MRTVQTRHGKVVTSLNLEQTVKLYEDKIHLYRKLSHRQIDNWKALKKFLYEKEDFDTIKEMERLAEAWL